MYYQNRKKQSLTIKDLVTIGIFTALFFVFELVGAFPLMLNPVTMFYMTFGIALLCGPIILLLLAKVPRRGTLTLVGVINGIVWFAMGMHWGMDLGYVIMAIIADLVAGLKQYKSIKLNIFAYSIFCLGPTGSFVVYFLDPAGWAATMIQNGTSQDMINALNASAHSWILPVILIGTIVFAVISGIIGKKLLKKQFEKAGMTE